MYEKYFLYTLVSYYKRAYFHVMRLGYCEISSGRVLFSSELMIASQLFTVSVRFLKEFMSPTGFGLVGVEFYIGVSLLIIRSSLKDSLYYPRVFADDFIVLLLSAVVFSLIFWMVSKLDSIRFSILTLP